MSETETYDNIVIANDGTEFTMDGARNLQDRLNRMPTGDVYYRWIDLQTGGTIFF